MIRRWINTLVLYDARGRVVKREGYWYDGPIAHASAMVTTDQVAYGFYQDDAGEATSTLIGSINTQQTLLTGTTFQVRLRVDETADASGNVNGKMLEYNHEGGGWNDVNGASSVIIAVDGQLTQGNDTTERTLGTASGGYDTTNAWQSTDGTLANNMLGALATADAVFNFQIVNADVSDGDEIILRVQGLDAYTSAGADIDVDKPVSARRIFVVG